VCGRYTLSADLEDIQSAFGNLGIDPAVVTPRYNIAPTQAVPIVRYASQPAIELSQWGLVPWWAKDPAIGIRTINARAETLATRPAFRDAYRSRRCWVLADGFYEWQRHPGLRRKLPVHIRLRSARPFAFAGLWDEWKTPQGGRLLSCTIVTTRPNALVAPIHDRMPVILRADHVAPWLEPGTPEPALPAMLEPYDAASMCATVVSDRVNDVEHDDPQCLEPIDVDALPGNYDLFE